MSHVKAATSLHADSGTGMVGPNAVLVLTLLACGCRTTDEATGTSGPGAPLDVSSYPKRLNPTAASGLVLYMGKGEGCHWVQAAVDVPGLMDAINKTEPASCDLMADPAWRQCPFGAVHANRAGSACICRTSGAPAVPMAACPK